MPPQPIKSWVIGRQVPRSGLQWCSCAPRAATVSGHHPRACGLGARSSSMPHLHTQSHALVHAEASPVFARAPGAQHENNLAQAVLLDRLDLLPSRQSSPARVGGPWCGTSSSSTTGYVDGGVPVSSSCFAFFACFDSDASWRDMMKCRCTGQREISKRWWWW